MSVMRFELEGLRDTLLKLRGVGKSIGRRAIRKGVRAGGSRLRALAKRYSPRNKDAGNQRIGKPGLLRQSISATVAKVKGQDKVVAVIGPRRGIKVNGANPAFYAHLPESGARPHEIRPKSGKKVLWFAPRGSHIRLPAGVIRHPGSKPQAWLRRASVFGAQEAVSAFRQKVAADILTQAAKAKPSEVDDGT